MSFVPQAKKISIVSHFVNCCLCSCLCGKWNNDKTSFYILNQPKKPRQLKKKKNYVSSNSPKLTESFLFFYFLSSLLTLRVSIIFSVVLCSSQSHTIKAHDGHPPLSPSTLVEPMSLGIECCRSILPDPSIAHKRNLHKNPKKKKKF